MNRRYGKFFISSGGLFRFPKTGKIESDNSRLLFPVLQYLFFVLGLYVLFCPIHIFAQTDKVVHSIPTVKKLIAYTLDDGPQPGITEEFLELFAREGVKATFFNKGSNLALHPELAAKVLAAGHEIGNHSMHHPKLTELDTDSIFSEINGFQELARKLLGYTPKSFRAPFLKTDDRVMNILDAQNLKLIDASVYTRDYAANVDPQFIIQKVLNNVKPGCIILGHEKEHTIEALKTIIPELKKRGYEFVTVSALLQYQAQTHFIPPDDPHIRISGAEFSKYSAQQVELQRHSDLLLSMPTNESLLNPQKARTTSGIIISFSTDSPTIRAGFKKLPGEQRNGLFTVFNNDNAISEFTINSQTDSIFYFEFDNPDTSSASLFEITLPTWNNLAFTGLEIDSAYDLTDLRQGDKKRYVAYGNSITHGTGQRGTKETYAFQVARHFGWELYNVAVGGAKTSVALADMIRDNFDHLDYLTILIGYNDYNNEGVDTTTYKNRYDAVLNSIREKHPQSDIFCITPTYTRQDSSKKTGIPVSDFRKAVANLVHHRQAQGDAHLFLIYGERITSEANLKDPATSNDPVHFSVDGAALFADSLIKAIRTILDSSATGMNYDTSKRRGSGAANNDFKVNVYPNPAGDMVTVQSNSPFRTIQLFNSLGQSVRSFGYEDRLFLSDLPNGMYFMEFKDKHNRIVYHKLILH